MLQQREAIVSLSNVAVNHVTECNVTVTNAEVMWVFSITKIAKKIINIVTLNHCKSYLV